MSQLPAVQEGAAGSSLLSPAATLAPTELALPANFPLALTGEQTTQITQELNGVTLGALALSDVPKLGSEVEVALHRVLGQFLDRIEKADQPRIFKLVGALSEAIDAEKLGDLADQILNAQPTLWEKVQGLFNKKALSRAVSRAYEDVRLMATGKSKKLSELIARMEQELRQEQAKLEGEIQTLEQLKQQYQARFVDFAMAVALINTLLTRSRTELAAAEVAQPQDMNHLANLRDKLQALESRALALEGLLSRLPSDQLVIRQLQNAGISTLQETSTTAAARFASIKMTLLTIHGALVTQGVQRLAQQGAQLDDNLLAVRSKLMKDVVGTAATAPGDNRLAQARQLQAIVADSQALVTLVEQSRAKNAQSFQQAREMFAQARQDMLAVGAVVRPDQPLAN
jgi:chromosome segregation ATPase